MALTTVGVGVGGTGVATSTGTGSAVLNTSPSFTTTIGVGNATPSASGAGISFPATQSASTDANTLDDYEEGTWTPASITAGLTISSINSAYYTKVGRQVTCYCYFAFNNTSGGAISSCSISGLPFSSLGYGFVNEYYASTGLATASQYIENTATYMNIAGANIPTGASPHMIYVSYFAT